MAKMQGTIGKFRKDRKAFEIDDVWYSAFKASWMGEAQSGDTVEFEYTEKGDFKNISEGTLKVTEQKPAGGGGNKGGGGKGGGYSKGEFRSVPQLVRTDAVNQALKVIEVQGAQYANEKTALKAVLYLANVIAAYVDGHIDMDGQDIPPALTDRVQAAKPAQSQVKHERKPTPDPEPEPQQEAKEPESPAPSLDAFLGD
jgi:hypothetical protein